MTGRNPARLHLTDYIPGVTEQGALDEIKTMMQKYLADTGQFPT
jgi:hypothetical protein